LRQIVYIITHVDLGLILYVVYSFESQLDIPHVPDMIFAQNSLSLLHERGFGIEFTTLEALKHVGNKHDLVQVAGAKEWKEARLRVLGLSLVLCSIQ
jgi:hypothetical protein